MNTEAPQKTKTPAISVLLAVYNTAPWLATCLDSILAQTFRDFECICVDDGSTDDSPQILARYAQMDLRIRVVTQANKGLSGARNTGIAHATGTYVCFLDSDDYVHPQMLEALHGRMEQDPVDVAVCGFENVTGERAFTPLDLSRLEWQTIVSPLEAFIRGEFRMHTTAWGKLFQRSLLENHPFIEGIVIAQDVVFTTCLLRDVKTVVYTPAVFNYYRKVSTSISHSAFSTKKAFSYLEGIRVIHDFYKRDDNPRVLDFLRRTIIKDSLKEMLSNLVRQSPDPAECLRLFAFIQPTIQTLMKKDAISYQGLRWRQKLVLFLLVNVAQPRYAHAAGRIFLRSRRLRFFAGR